MEPLRYEDSDIDSRILRAVTEMGFETMTPIQEQAIPLLLEGKDVIGQAQTGTGKTAAFGIPMLQRIDPDNKNLQGIILCPTRELAMQAAEELRRFTKYMHGIKVLPVYGGQDINKQIYGLKGVQIVVGTPGRVMDHMRRHTIRMQEVSMVVLDEADEMLNMGFREDMETILKEVPKGHQTALFSATMPQAILDITDQYQQDAVLVKVAAKELTVPLVTQYYYVLKQSYKAEAIIRLLQYYNFHRCLIFCNTKRMVDELSELLQGRGFSAEGLHGDLTQNQRDSAMGRFRGGSLDILIATDVAARGIDVYDVEAVFNYDIPQDIEYYVHRIGRTGRAGKEGKSFTLTSPREIWRIREIERTCHTKMTERHIPTPTETAARRAEKELDRALKVLSSGKSGKYVPVVQKKLSELGITAEELAAAFLKLNLGEDLQAHPMDAPKPDARDRRRERRQGIAPKGSGQTLDKERKPRRKEQDGKERQKEKKPFFSKKRTADADKAPGRKRQNPDAAFQQKSKKDRKEASRRQLKKALKDVRRNGQPYLK